jgi:hypothetical protein
VDEIAKVLETEKRAGLESPALNERTARVQRLARATLVCAGLAALGPASAAVVHADIPCNQWRFDDYTELDWSDGGKFTFDANGTSVPEGTLVLAIPPGGGPAKTDKVSGNIEGHNNIHLYTPRLYIQGGVTDDGFAYGIATDFDLPGRSGSWRSAQPLKCADNGG